VLVQLLVEDLARILCGESDVGVYSPLCEMLFGPGEGSMSRAPSTSEINMFALRPSMFKSIEARTNENGMQTD
jgi:hypothetical protein